MIEEENIKSHNLSFYNLVKFNHADKSLTSPAAQWTKGNLFLQFSTWIHLYVLSSSFHLSFSFSPCYEKTFISIHSLLRVFFFLSACLVLLWEHVLCDEKDLLLAEVWLSGWQLALLFIFLFISGALNWHMLGRSRHQQAWVDEKVDGKRWTDVWTVMRVSHQRLWTSGHYVLIGQHVFVNENTKMYTLDTHSKTQMNTSSYVDMGKHLIS